MKLKRIALHANPLTAFAAVREALGISRQALWKKECNAPDFPKAKTIPDRDGRTRYYKTEDLARWLVANRYKVIWI